MGNRPPQPVVNRAAPQCDFEINSPKKMSKRGKYEGKCLEQSCCVCVSRSCDAPAIVRSVGESSLLFILAAGSFSNMFTTYSHAFVVVLASRLRLEISHESDKKKMNLILNFDKKIFLTEKMKDARWCEKKNSVSKKPGASQIAAIRDRRAARISLPIVCECRVDRTGLCVKFPAAASEGQTLSKL